MRLPVMMETRSGKRRREQRDRELRELEEEELRWQEFAKRVKSLPPEVKSHIWTFSGICAGCYENTSAIHNEDYFVSYQEEIDKNSRHNRMYPCYCRTCEIVYCRECSLSFMMRGLDGMRRHCEPCGTRRVQASN